MSITKDSTDSSRKETLCIGIHLREPDPPNVNANRYRESVWKETYRLLWKLKLIGGYY